MSPERLEGEAYDSSADIWSLGCVASECAFGQFPFSIADPGSFMCVLNAVMAPPMSLPSHPTLHVHNFVTACLAKVPVQRPSGAQLLQHPFFANAEKGRNDLHKLLKRLM